MMIIWLFVYDSTVGPLAYAIVGEVSSSRLRSKTVALSRLSYNVFSVTFGVMMPYMLVSHALDRQSSTNVQNPTAWNLRGKIGFLWAPICALCWVWAYYRLPEMKVSRLLESYLQGADNSGTQLL